MLSQGMPLILTFDYCFFKIIQTYTSLSELLGNLIIIIYRFIVSHEENLNKKSNSYFIMGLILVLKFTSTTTDIKTNMRHIHTSIVSRHLATRGKNKILRTPPPHTSSSEEILPRLTRRTLAQLRTNKSPFLKSYLHKVDAKTHPSPLCPLCNIHTHDTHHLFNCTHIRTTLSPLDLWTDPAGVTALLARWTEKLAGGPQAGTSDSPTSKGHGSG